MKKIILLTTLLFLIFSFGTEVLAQEVELSDPGLTPDSPFYFLDTLGERIGMFFTFGAEKKAEKAIKYAEEKLAEVMAMVEKNQTEALEKANKNYQGFLGLANIKIQEAKEKGKDIEELAVLITEKTLKHHGVLIKVFEKVPEQAKETIQKAIEVSRKGSEEAVKAVTGAKKEELQQKIKTIDWQIFTDSKAGYTIKYPSDWRRVDFENGIGVGPQEIREDILWGLWFYDSSQKSKYGIIREIGRQFYETGRFEERENIRFNNIQALKIIVTPSQYPDWYSESIIIEYGGKIFRIGNGAVKDDKFELFYKSFKFIESKKAVEEIPELEKEKLQKKDVAAIVNGVEITMDEFIQRLWIYIRSNESQMRQVAAWQKTNETDDEFVQRFIPLVGEGVLEFMIIEIIIQQKAKEQNIMVKPEEIDNKIDELKLTAEKLSKVGITTEELRQQIESQILMEKIVVKEVGIVTEKEVRDYFERSKTNFAKPEEIKASHILLRTEVEAEVILSQLKVGADFVELARKESTDPGTKDKAGDLGFFSRGKMTPAFEKAAFALEIGEISEVVKTPYGYHIIRLEEKKSAQEPNFELEREEIKETITQQKIWTMRSNLLQNLRKEAKVEIKLPEFRD
ncbi:Foldase protein PrsA [subsurface metagenome]